MTKVAVQGYRETRSDLPLYEDFIKRMDAVRQRAFELFETRGAVPGSELDDWISAEHEVLGWPKAEMREKETEFEMDLTLPGFAANEIEVTATPSEVLVHACNERKRSSGDARIMWSEFSNNEVFRRFVFPEAVTPEGVTAQLEDGVLHVHAPRTANGANGAEKAAPSK
jgi:HSP20 family protein